MTSHPLFEYLRISFEEKYPGTFYKSFCYFKRPIDEYKAMSTILQVAGHDTTEMNNAINDVETAVHKLKAVTNAARSRFMLNGVVDYTSIIPMLGK
jgi:hypothetical protein